MDKPERPKMFSLPLATAELPVDGEVLCDRWWLVDEAGGPLFYTPDGDAVFPQCNASHEISSRIMQRTDGAYGVKHIPVVFMGQARREARRLVSEWKARDREWRSQPCTCRWEGEPPTLVPCTASRHPWRAGSPDGPQPPTP